MKKQLLTLQQLIAVMDPEIYRHLEKIDGLNLFFCFRWVLIAFKREFGFDDVLRLWEVLWTDYYSNQFVLFVALAVIESHRDVILRYLVEVRPFPSRSSLPYPMPCADWDPNCSSTRFSSTATS